MKKIFTTVLVSAIATFAFAQEFDKNLDAAKTAYSGGNLQDARFAMQQMLNDIDLLVGKEILKSLPATLDANAANSKNDNVTNAGGLAGVVVHRDYGTDEKMIALDIMGNSPMVASINALLSLPFVGNSGDGTQKNVKIQGYKAILQKSVDSETNKTSYTLQIPINSTLVTLNVPDSTEPDVMKYANLIPVQQIAKLVQ